MIKVYNPGLFTTIQDKGRFGLRDKGVPISGAMDEKAADHANAIAGNSVGAAVMEITMTGPVLEFEEGCEFAISGALLSPQLDDQPLQNNIRYKAQPGQRLKFGRLKKGFRAYLAIKGGFDTPLVLGSRSWYYPITPGDHLRKGDVLEVGDSEPDHGSKTSSYAESYLSGEILAVDPGPEYKLLSDLQKEQLHKGIFRVAHENNRMAYQLKEKIYAHDLSILTSATQPGTVQCTPEGKLIILMKDGQTTGGYPRILQLTPEAIARLSQKKEGDTVIFRFQLKKAAY
ncbi:biotin-dependent carboxyltransferase [Robertkochia marina]|uniref:Biotin-dependent carboxyltransferase n=1 Tax=Robertkochia marina TaxID=1227945 RepID=A0A4S3M0Y2_9FLAO|nr:biotin-dependent carboxyltransferase family protein [Robertkochia marina]THD67687.1 biotin-dependent carboxyltransferase [Robertkochia marina]TRZ43418.1 biotin-dependent carboxyltransferase [Robertkochia marina]